jgi:heterodisulfide reductase subunit A
LLEKEIILEPDLIVLSAGIRPNPENQELGKLLKVPLTKDGFFLEAHMKLRPVDFMTEGIFLCGLAHGPKFIEESISQA